MERGGQECHIFNPDDTKNKAKEQDHFTLLITPIIKCSLTPTESEN